MADLRLRLSGPFAAESGDGRALDLPVRGQAILAYLAEGGRGRASRAALAALIWPDRAEEQARASLRQELSALRRVLPEGVIGADRSDVTLDLDRVAFLPPEEAKPFLDGISLRSEPFEDWLRAARTRDLSARVTAALAAARRLLDTDPAGAVAAAEAALALDPHAEPAVRLLMEAEAAAGNRAGALAAFERFREALADALDAAPDAETEALAARIRSGAARGAAAEAPRRASDRPTLAVLAFEELGAGPGDMFADGIVEEITGALSRVHEFHVIARQSAFALRSATLDARAAAERLGADYLVEGSVRRAGERVRIAVQLVDGATGRALWSERFDDRIDDLFDLQDRIAAQVAGQIAPNLRTAEIDRAKTTPPASRSAYELVLTAYPHFWSHRKEDNARALELLDAAVKRDPEYALALALKAWVHAQQCTYTWTDDPARDRALAQEAALKAEERAGDHAPTLVAICAAISLTSPDYDRPRAIIDRALAIDPNNAWGWMRSGWLNTLQNRPELSLEQFDRAEALSPLDPFLFNVQFGKANSMAELGRLEEAAALVRAGLNMAPGVTWAYRMLAAYYGQLGDIARAQEVLAIYLRHYPGMTIARLRASMPPSIFETQPFYIDGLRAAGVPEE